MGVYQFSLPLLALGRTALALVGAATLNVGSYTMLASFILVIAAVVYSLVSCSDQPFSLCRDQQQALLRCKRSLHYIRVPSVTSLSQALGHPPPALLHQPPLRSPRTPLPWVSSHQTAEMLC